jgi:hypothetical protein
VKVTHAGRKHGSNRASLLGYNSIFFFSFLCLICTILYMEYFRLKKHEIAQIGKWNKDKLDISYLTDAPIKSLIVLSGVEKEKIKNLPRSCWYVLPRSRVTVPSILKKAILPWVDSNITFLQELT